MKSGLAIAACTALLVAGCATSDDSGDVVRSRSGPSPTQSGSTDEGAADATPTVDTAAPATSQMLVVRGEVSIPDGAENELSVVMTGKPQKSLSNSIPVVIRNRTADAIANVQVTGTARGADGSLTGSGASQGFAPATVGPGEWAYDYVFFDGPDLPADAKFDLTATGSDPDEDFGSLDARVVEVERVPGDYNDQFIGIVENPSSTDEMGGPIDVMVACFDKAGAITSTQSGYAKAESIAPSGTSSFSVDLYDDPCPTWAMGSSGYTF